MLDTLRRLLDEGPLIEVAYGLLDGDREFVVGVGLRFEGGVVEFRASMDHDGLDVVPDQMATGPDEWVLPASRLPPWRDFVGRPVWRAWQLTSTSGVVDGVRLDFSDPDEEYRAVDLVATHASIVVFDSRVAPAGE